MKFAWITAALVCLASLNSADAGLFGRHGGCGCAAPAPVCCSPAPTCAAPAAVRSGCCCSGCSSGLLRSGCRPDLLCPRRRADLLRSGPDLLRQQLWLRQRLLQAEEVRSRLVWWVQEPLREDEEEPLLLDLELLPCRADLLRPGCSQLLRSGRSDVRRSGRVLLPLIADDLPGDRDERCCTQQSSPSREREAESGGDPPLPRTRLANKCRDEHLELA